MPRHENVMQICKKAFNGIRTALKPPTLSIYLYFFLPYSPLKLIWLQIVFGFGLVWPSAGNPERSTENLANIIVITSPLSVFEFHMASDQGFVCIRRLDSWKTICKPSY